MMAGGERVLVVAAHPDDEALGCGGTIARHVKAGHCVKILFLADGVGARNPQDTAQSDLLCERRSASLHAISHLGAREPTFLDFPDNRLDTVALLDVVQAIEKHAFEFAPTRVYTHHGNDLNVDHRVAAQAVMTAFRPVPHQGVRSIYGFETLSSTEWAFGMREPWFCPQRFVNVAITLDAKLDALRAYKMEMRAFPHPRSLQAVEALARYRGASAGFEAAEAFTVLRDIEP
jgi:N-acetylglucosamine malate deacetylase 1